jgi:hypothetical protein
VTKVAEKPTASDAQGGDPLRDLVLARIASAARPIDKGEIAADLSFLAGAQMPASRWRETVEGAIRALSGAGQVAHKPGGYAATPAGAAAAARLLGVGSGVTLTWEKACSMWLIAKALGERRPTPKRLAALVTLEGLRAAILVRAYGLHIKGAVTPARLRQGLAAVALRKAFGGETAAAVAGRSGLPARASRLLAAQLLDKPRDPGTDRRLVSALAEQVCGARAGDLAALRAGVLQRFFAAPPEVRETAANADVRRRASGGAQPPRQQRRTEASPADARGPIRSGVSPTPGPSPHFDGVPPARREGDSSRVYGEFNRSASNAASAEAPRGALGTVSSPPASRPLDLPGFATEVRRLAAGEAQGWSGDRKAYISRVWRTVREKRPEWGLSEIEFKCMLAEAHRSGQLNLANADLKDESNIKDVQDSAVSYRNAVFHFIRVDA